MRKLKGRKWGNEEGRMISRMDMKGEIREGFRWTEGRDEKAEDT
jgi:hypothetical protein